MGPDISTRSWCLLCLTTVEQQNLHEKHVATSSTSSTSSSNARPVTELCQLIQHSQFEHSTPHRNIIDQFENAECFLCQQCSSLIDSAQEIRKQILQLQSQLTEKVVVIRSKILESDEELKLNVGKENYNCLNQILPIRQSILNLSDDDENALDISNIQVKVKIEAEEDVAHNFLDSCSPSSFLLQPDEDCFKEESNRDSEPESTFLISPEKNKKHQKRSKVIGNDRVPKKRGRPPKAEISPSKIEKPLRKSTRAIQILSSSSSESVSEFENSEAEEVEDPMNCDDDLEDDEDYFKEKSKVKACSKKVKTKAQRKNHKKSKNGNVKSAYPCTICKRKFFRIGSLEAHYYIKHEGKEKKFVCTLCSKAFSLKINFDRHTELHKREFDKPLVCDVCDSRFADEFRLKRHIATHNKKFVCNICNSVLATKTGFARHMRIHSGLKPFKCDHCDEHFIDQSKLAYHIHKVHEPPENHFCTICNKSFINLYSLKGHLDRHEGKYAVTCETCGEKFSDMSTLKTHKIQNHNEEPLICDECGAKYMTEKGLKQHKMSHAGEKPHKCEICDARFLSKWVLVNHKRSHTNERPYLCSCCGKGFKCKKHLDTHVKSIHSEDYVVRTPFVCDQCGKAYPRKTILDGHIRQVHTLERPFVCEVSECNKGFALKTTLRLHLKSHGIYLSNNGQRLPRSKREIPPKPPAKAQTRKKQSESSLTPCSTPSTTTADSIEFNNRPQDSFRDDNNDNNSHSSSVFNSSISHYYHM